MMKFIKLTTQYGNPVFIAIDKIIAFKEGEFEGEYGTQIWTGSGDADYWHIKESIGHVIQLITPPLEEE